MICDSRAVPCERCSGTSAEDRGSAQTTPFLRRCFQSARGQWLKTGLAIASLAVSLGAAPAQAQHRVVIFGVDGMGGTWVNQTNTPNIYKLMQEGAWTLKMRAVRETSSSGNWAAQIMGTPPELNGVINNGWQPNDGKSFTPACEDAPGIFPTIFGLARQQYPKMKIGVFTDWYDYVRLFEPNVTSVTYKGEDDFAHALAYLESDRPELLFIHLDFVDGAGHHKGWGGPEYLMALRKADDMLGQLLEKLDQLGLRKSTDVLVVADHGGWTTHHGGDHQTEIEVPWIISGPGIKKGYALPEKNLMQYDTAATVARILKVKPSPCWRSVSIDDAFTKKK